MSYIPEEPPGDNEAYEPFDEALDEEDIEGEGLGPEGQRDLDTEIIVDEIELEEAGANLEDPDRISLLTDSLGDMDDPDGSGPPQERDDPEAGWDVDPVARDQESSEESDGADEADSQEDPELELFDMDATDMDQFPDDAPGSDSARW
jgi:hypothetical protein